MCVFVSVHVLALVGVVLVESEQRNISHSCMQTTRAFLFGLVPDQSPCQNLPDVFVETRAVPCVLSKEMKMLLRLLITVTWLPAARVCVQ